MCDFLEEILYFTVKPTRQTDKSLVSQAAQAKYHLDGLNIL